MIQQTEAVASTRQKAGSRLTAPFTGLAFCLLGCVLFAGCEIDTYLSQDSGSGESSIISEGIPPIDEVSYEQTEVATFALG